MTQPTDRTLTEHERRRLYAEWAYLKARMRELAALLEFADPFPDRPYRERVDNNKRSDL